MSKIKKLLSRLLQAKSDKNFSFDELCKILDNLEFEKRIKGSHHIYWKKEIEDIINIQPDGSKAKPYQVKQVRNIILKNKLHLSE